MSERVCPDCAVAPGFPHLDTCDVARCMWTGHQRLQCALGLAAECCAVLRRALADELADDLAHYLDLDDPEHDCGHDVWTGEWPGDADCAALGFWTYWGPPWIECDASHPNATADLNRLHEPFARWDRTTGHWVAGKAS